MSPPRVFVSYAREDAAAALRLSTDLTAAGLEPWIDVDRILPGQLWERQIERGLAAADYVVLLLSTSSVNKNGYVQKEVQDIVELRKRRPEATVFAIPARLNECPLPHASLSDLQWVDLFPDWDHGLARIIEVCKFLPTGNHKDPQVVTDQPAPAISPIVGTTWAGSDSNGDRWMFRFGAGGHLEYDSPSGDRTSASWRQNDAVFYMELNNDYAQLRATRVGTSLHGEGRNLPGGTWSFSLEQQATPPDLVGTTWAGHDSNGDRWVLHFRDGGRLDYRRPDRPRAHRLLAAGRHGR